MYHLLVLMQKARFDQTNSKLCLVNSKKYQKIFTAKFVSCVFIFAYSVLHIQILLFSFLSSIMLMDFGFTNYTYKKIRYCRKLKL